MISLSSRSTVFFLTFVLGLLASISAHAASLKQVSGWNGGVSLPSDVTMSIYVPDKLAANPPIVTVIHYCGGNAQAVLGQAKDIQAAADKFGFIMVLPAQTHSGGCWDVSSKKSQTHDGGGDTHAIAQMIKYTVAQYKANADRVYSTGDSSGGMMTQLLLAVYPDIFKAGSAFAGVPAGCSNVFDNTGACGLSSQNAQQWGDRVRAMYPGYSGHRPRVQLIHGDNDTTITYKNYGESIEEWTNVLGLSTEPTTTTSSGITLGTHQGKRQEWKNSCGYVVLDGLTSIGGNHGPEDCLFIGKYVLPFLGLDSQEAVDALVDPEIAKCGGAGGSDGGVTTPDAGKPDGAAGGSTGSTGGNSGTGGGTGGKGGGTGGTGTPGTSSAGGGTTSTGGKGGGGTTGAQSSGGQSSIGGASSSSSSSSASGGGGSSSANGGSSSSVASSSSSKGGSSAASKSDNSGSSSNSRSGGGGCSMGAASPASAWTILLALGLTLLTFRRKRR